MHAGAHLSLIQEGGCCWGELVQAFQVSSVDRCYLSRASQASPMDSFSTVLNKHQNASPKTLKDPPEVS